MLEGGLMKKSDSENTFYSFRNGISCYHLFYRRNYCIKRF